MSVRVPVYRGRRDRGAVIVAYTLVDDCDAAWARSHHWTLDAQGYAVRRAPRPARTSLKMHRELLGLGGADKRVSDHRNRDKLDNRRANLRVVDRAENNQNRDPYRNGTGRFRGVCWSKTKGKWRAYAQVDGAWQHLGYFEDEEEAGRVAAAYRTEHMPFAVEGAAA